MAVLLGVLVFGVILLTTSNDSTTPYYVLITALAMAFSLAVLILLMKVCRTWLERFLPKSIVGAYRRFHHGTLGSFKQLPVIFALSLIGWILEMGRLYFVIQALDLSVSLGLVPVVALGHAILSAVPTPGGVGAVEPGVTGLLLIELGRDEAVSVALVDRSITYVSVVLIGGLVFLLRQVVQAKKSCDHPRSQTIDGA